MNDYRTNAKEFPPLPKTPWTVYMRDVLRRAILPAFIIAIPNVIIFALNGIEYHNNGEDRIALNNKEKQMDDQNLERIKQVDEHRKAVEEEIKKEIAIAQKEYETVKLDVKLIQIKHQLDTMPIEKIKELASESMARNGTP